MAGHRTEREKVQVREDFKNLFYFILYCSIVDLQCSVSFSYSKVIQLCVCV